MLHSHFFNQPCSLFVAANRLPFSIFQEQDEWSFSESPGGLVSALKNVDLKMDWIGWLGNEIPKADQKEIQSKLARRSNHFVLHPVFLTQEDKENYYNGFANQMIWPNFHDLSQMMHYSEKHWLSYQEVNKKFAQEIFQSLKEHSLEKPEEELLVWIHDYQLMLVSSYLHKLLQESHLFRFIKVKIGFFLHIPFPKLEVFQHFPEEIRTTLLEGLLSTDLIGVHEQSYLDNFVETVRQHIITVSPDIILDENCIHNKKHSTYLGVYPIGIEPHVFEENAGLKTLNRRVAEILAPYTSYKIILGVDRLDPTKGLLEKLQAYADFLENSPHLANKTVLIQVAVPSRTDIADYQELKKQFFKLSEEINRKYQQPNGPPVVVILYENFAIEELAQLYHAADTLLVTSLKDGMNLVSFEYTVCQSPDSFNSKMGPLILSKNAGASRYLHGSLVIDPLNIKEVGKTIATALSMSKKERESRFLANQVYVKAHTATSWAQEFISDLKYLDNCTFNSSYSVRAI